MNLLSLIYELNSLSYYLLVILQIHQVLIVVLNKS
jgi:hypothetical protein